MSVDWDEVNRALYPIKDYEDCCQRWRESFDYPFVRETFDFTVPAIIRYTRLVLGGDPRGRYTGYVSMLERTFTKLHEAGVQTVTELMARIETPERMEAFCTQSGVRAQDIAAALKYLIYWCIPMKKLLSGLVGDNPQMRDAIKVLRGLGVRTNLDLLQQGIAAAGRRELADASGLPEEVITELVNVADLSRMPWASKATISNIMGAGYGSLARLADADPEQLYADFFQYGRAIGKNLKLGNEIESSHRIAKVVPVLLQTD